jgi:hypothetical protein
MESSARSNERQPSGIVLLPTLVSSCGYFPTPTKIEKPRSAITKHPAAAATGVRPKAKWDSSGYTRSES